MQIVFISAFLAVLSGSAMAADPSEASRFVDYCRAVITFSNQKTPDPAVAMNMGFCLGLMDGVRGANVFLKIAKSKAAFCEPDGIKNDDLATAFVATVDRNPSLRDLRGSLAVLVALRDAFPCKKAK